MMKLNYFVKAGIIAMVTFSVACNQTKVKSTVPNISDSVTLLNPDEIKAGTQIWAINNLSLAHFRNGDPIAEAKTNEEWEKAGEKGIPAWCNYGNDTSNGKKYGKLYNWFAIHDKRGLAPTGWHIPDDEEWNKLIDYWGGADSAGTKLKTNTGWIDNGNGINSSLFSGSPGGYRYNNGAFNGLGKYGSWWSNSEFDANGSWYRYLSAAESKVTRNYSDKKDGFSVRCIRDSSN